MMVSGDVVDIQSHWTSDNASIVSEATIDTPDGMVVVMTFGGSADGLGQIVFDGEPQLVKGMFVTHVISDGIKIRSLPTGFVRTGPTKSGNPLFWESGCIHLTVDSDGTKEIAGDGEFPVIDACIATWNDDTVNCSYLKVVEDGRRSVEVNGKDYTNVLKFRDASWCRPMTADAPAKCYSVDSAGITTATYVDDGGMRDGAIVDADIEINGVNFSIAVNGVTAGVNGCAAELANTLTHELGHLHGLEHTCLAAGDPPRTDGNGHAVPSCSAPALDPAIVEATMYPFQDCGESKKETLEADDIAGICAVYPTANDPHSCAPVEIASGCCSAGGSPLGPFALTAFVGFVALRKTRRRR